MRPRINRTTLLLISLFVSNVRAQQTKVSIADLWGVLTLRAGEAPEQIKCFATNASPNGSFLWTIGEVSLPEITEKEEISPNEYEQTYNLDPRVEYDGKELKCKYVERDARGKILSEAEDSLTISITYLRLPQGKVNSGQYLLGQDVELTVQFEMFPPPEKGKVMWIITEEEAGEETVVGTGESISSYTVGRLDDLGDHRYSSSLFIERPEESEATKKHEFWLELEGNDRSMVPVVFSLVRDVTSAPVPPNSVPREEETHDSEEDDGTKKEEEVEAAVVEKPDDDEEELEDQEEEERNSDFRETKPPYITDSTTEAPTEATLGVGIFVIVAIVVLIILVCMGYCIFRRFCAQNNSQSSGPDSNKKPNYIQAPTEEKDNHPV